MFQSTKKRLQTLLEVVDDMLVGLPEEERLDEAAALHPHARTVALRIQRRAGAVTPRPMHCLCPVSRPAAPAPVARDLAR